MNNLYAFYKGFSSKYSEKALSLLIAFVVLFVIAPIILFVGFLFVSGSHDYFVQILSLKGDLDSGEEILNYVISTIMIYLASSIIYIFLLISLFTPKHQAQKIQSIKAKASDWFKAVVEHGKSINK